MNEIDVELLIFCREKARFVEQEIYTKLKHWKPDE